MDRAYVARRMAEAPRCLVVEEGSGGDSLRSLLERQLGEDIDVVSAFEQGKASIEAVRSLLSDHVFGVVVIDVDSLEAQWKSEQGPRRFAQNLATIVEQNPSTAFLLVSSKGRIEPSEVLRTSLPILSALPEEEEEQGSKVEAVERAVKVVDRESLPERVEKELRFDGLIAQFKSRGYTRFLPPLDPFLLSLSLRLFGQNEFGARFPGVLLAVVLLVCSFALSRRLFGTFEARASAAILGTSALYYLSARFVANDLSWTLGLLWGVWAIAMANGSKGLSLKGLCLILVAFTWLYLSNGMTAVVTLTTIAVAFPLVLWDFRRPRIVFALVALLVTGLFGLITFLPDSPVFRAFRFTAPLMEAGLRQEARTFDFVLKEIGFGMFPWSALLPFALSATLNGERPKPYRILVLLWALAPAVVTMITIRQMNQTYYAGLPALAMATALYLVETKEFSTDSRILAFVGFGLFVVMLKDILLSPAPLITYLTTDPMFSEQGKGDMPFPPEVRLHFTGIVAALLAGVAIFLGPGKVLSALSRLPDWLRQRRVFFLALGVLTFLILLDWVIFIGLKWETLTGSEAQVAKGDVLLRIFLTGPDVIFLYLCVCALLLARYFALHGSRFEGSKACLAFRSFRAFVESPKGTLITVGLGSFALFIVVAYHLFQEVSYHVSQKHIIETYEASNARAPGELLRHGSFGRSGSEDRNFYTAKVQEVTSRNVVIDRLLDTQKRSFFILPKDQFSEINYAFRSRSGGRHIPVLDDRSSRFILAASSLAPGEEDRNWIAKHTLKEAEFKQLQGVERLSVNFDNKVELVGIKLSSSAVRRGGSVTITMYFKSTGRLTTSYRVFIHVDRVGSSSRIHGEHFVLNLTRETEDTKTCTGCYSTAHWIPGDIIVDEYTLEVPIGSPSGPHHIWMGFYEPAGGARLPVKDYDRSKVRHDGQNRVAVGILTVE